MRDVVYSPILRAKPGEIEGLAHLSPNAKVLTRPILELPLPSEAEGLSTCISSKAVTFAETWGTHLPLYVDLSLYGPEIQTLDGKTALEFFTICAAQANLMFVPVTGPQELRGPGTVYGDTIASIVRRFGRGAALRLPLADLANSGNPFEYMAEALRFNGLQAHQADLLIDLNSLDDIDPSFRPDSSLLITLQDVFFAASQFMFRSVAMIGSSIPKAAGITGSKTPQIVARRDFELWSELTRSKKFGHVIFGDYGIVHAKQSDPVGPVIAPSRIRLSDLTSHYFYKGKPADYQQIAEIAKRSSYFAAQPDCWGKKAVNDAARGARGVGAAPQWIARDTNIHIEFMSQGIRRTLKSMDAQTQLNVAEPISEPWYQESFPEDEG